MQVDLLEEFVKHCEELKLLSEVRARKGNQEKKERDAKVYEAMTGLILSSQGI